MPNPLGRDLLSLALTPFRGAAQFKFRTPAGISHVPISLASRAAIAKDCTCFEVAFDPDVRTGGGVPKGQ
eukprot:15434259-Alexandrium_andersonii.AAC.1